ncbi:MAG: YHYH protein [Bacteroidota bacterium]
MIKQLLCILPLLPLYGWSQCVPTDIFSNDSTNAVCITTDSKVRTVYTNNLPPHPFGTWPSNNPVDAQDLTFYMCAFPQKAAQSTSIYDAGDLNGCSSNVEFGVSANGIRMAPFGARWWVNPNTQEENRDWNVEALEMFSMDFNNSHSNGGGQYHYHGIPMVYFTDSLAIDSTQHSPLIGYAADGFPIYYKYAYADPQDPQSGIAAFTSGYTLKSGNRPGDGVTEPDGPYDGFYVEDYEYVVSNWELDECNGRFGITPEYPQGTYYYVMTDNWPYIPRCFYGTVIDNTFRIGPNCPPTNAAVDCSEEVISNIGELSEVQVLVAPNPASHSLRILSADPGFLSKITQVSIYDAQGKIWYSHPGLQASIDLSGLASGQYFLQLSTKDEQLTKKILVQK